MSRLSASIASDHAELGGYYAKYVQAAGNATERAKYANLFGWKLAIHSVAEELIWYPELETAFGSTEGKKLADQNRAEHQQLKVDLEKLLQLNESDAQFAPLLEKIYNEVKAHLQQEETVELPKFEAKISEEQSVALAKKFERAKKYLPNYAVPGAPNKSPYATPVALLSAPLDKVKDLFATLPESESNK
jgi:hypothetical protein